MISFVLSCLWLLAFVSVFPFFFFFYFFFFLLTFSCASYLMSWRTNLCQVFFFLVFIQGSDWWWGGCLTFIRYMKVLNVYALVRVTPILHIQWLMLMGKLLHAQVLLFSSLCHENCFITIFSFTAFYWCIIDHAVILLYVNWNHGL